MVLAKTNKNSLRLDADFTEDTVGLALESFLTFLSFPRQRFSIEPFFRSKERWLGADARLESKIKSFKPFYMQFKRPSAYPDISAAKVITDRKTLGLPFAPRTLYFGLREKQDSHFDYQHNILFRLRRRLLAKGIGDATYVCPLFLDRSAYRFHVHISGLKLWPMLWHYAPWDLEDLLINGVGGKLSFDGIPVFREHVSIPPHALVKNAKHSYSFTELGRDICFHSRLALPKHEATLADFLKATIGDLESDDGYVQADNALRTLLNLFSTPESNDDSSLLPENFPIGQEGIGAWLHWGEYLRQEFQIEQFALVRWNS